MSKDDTKSTHTLIQEKRHLEATIRYLRVVLAPAIAALQSVNAGFTEDNFGREIRDGLAALDATKEGGTSEQELIESSRLAEQVRSLREASEALIDWMREAELELGGPLNVGYRARVQKPVVIGRMRDVLKATKEEP